MESIPSSIPSDSSNSNGVKEEKKWKNKKNEGDSESAIKRSMSVSEELAKFASPKVVSFWKEFADFAFQGNVIDLSIGLIMGILKRNQS